MYFDSNFSEICSQGSRYKLASIGSDKGSVPGRQQAIIRTNGGLVYWYIYASLNSSPPGQNGCHFADDIFKCIFMNEKFSILIQISLKFVPTGPIENKPAVVQIMAWRRTGDKPLS